MKASHLLRRSGRGTETARRFRDPLRSRCMLTSTEPCCPIWVSPLWALWFLPFSADEKANHNPVMLQRCNTPNGSLKVSFLFKFTPWFCNVSQLGVCQSDVQSSPLVSLVGCPCPISLQLWVRKTDVFFFYEQIKLPGRELMLFLHLPVFSCFNWRVLSLQ